MILRIPLRYTKLALPESLKERCCSSSSKTLRLLAGLVPTPKCSMQSRLEERIKYCPSHPARHSALRATRHLWPHCRSDRLGLGFGVNKGLGFRVWGVPFGVKVSGWKKYSKGPRSYFSFLGRKGCMGTVWALRRYCIPIYVPFGLRLGVTASGLLPHPDPEEARCLYQGLGFRI